MRRLFILHALIAGHCLLAQGKPVLFHHVRLFDGTTVVPVADVLIKDGKIVAVDSSLSVPDARVVDGAGKTLLPGFIDAHVHVHSRESLEQALAFGVTTELDMMMPPRLESVLKSQEGDDLASFFSAGFPATVPGGHGTEYGEVPTLTKPSEAASFVDERLNEGSDYIKIMYTAGVDLGPRFRPRPTLDKQTVAALVAAAHAHHRLVVVHIGALQGARDVIDAGADGLAHLFHGSSSPSDFGEFVAAHHAFVIPTLSVLQSSCGPRSAGESLIADPDLAPFLDGDTRERLTETFPVARTGYVSCRGAAQAVRQLSAATVPILAGSDAPNPGTGYGVTLHGELALLVSAGLTPVQALVSATSAPAAAFHISDRGTIAPGMRADLVLVAGDPTEHIGDTRKIVSVYKGGVEFDRESYRKRKH
jgi:imidazolonepropionase-like amidohydrolase